MTVKLMILVWVFGTIAITTHLPMRTLRPLRAVLKVLPKNN